MNNKDEKSPKIQKETAQQSNCHWHFPTEILILS